MGKKGPGQALALQSAGVIERKIYLFRGHKVMLDSDLAKLYGVPTKAFNQQSNEMPTGFRRISCSD
jgi:hypothetical protein